MLYFLKFPDLTIGRKCKQPTCMFNIYKIYFYFMFVNVYLSVCMSTIGMQGSQKKTSDALKL